MTLFERERSSAFQVTVCVFLFFLLFLFFLFSDLSIHKQLKRPSLPIGVRSLRGAVVMEVECLEVKDQG